MNAETFNELPQAVWPVNACRQEDGVVTIADVPLPEIVAKYGSPVMVVDEADFRSRCRDMARAYGAPHRVHYASKSFLSTMIARWVEEEGLSLDVASEGELRIALAASFPTSRITAHGNNKTASFMRCIIDEKVGTVVLDSFDEIEKLSALAEERGAHLDVLIRVTPGIKAHTHEFIATAHEDQKFGFSLSSGAARRAAEAVLESSSLRLIGLHCHVGSQVFDAHGFSLAAERLLTLREEILDSSISDRATLDAQLRVLDLGGGYGIAYTAEESSLDVASVAAELIEAVENISADKNMRVPEVFVEPGRAISGPSTVTVYEVGTIKDVPVDEDTERRYISVDGGISDNIRPSLYGAEYDARVVSRFVDGTEMPSRIVGSHCESGDILIKDIELPDDIENGDLIALAATGAYCYSLASNYNAFNKPAVIVVNNGDDAVMLRRTTVEDLLALEPQA